MTTDDLRAILDACDERDALRRALDECRQHHADTLAGRPEGAHAEAAPLDVDVLARALDTPGVFEDELGPHEAAALAEDIAREYRAILAETDR